MLVHNDFTLKVEYKLDYNTSQSYGGAVELQMQSSTMQKIDFTRLWSERAETPIGPHEKEAGVITSTLFVATFRN